MIELRQSYVDRFAALPAVQQCAPHDGEFRAEEVARLGAPRTPAVFVACLGLIAMLDQSGPPAGQLQWAAFVVTRSPDGVRESARSGGDVGALIALRIAAELFGGPVFDASLDAPDRIRAQNLFATSSASKGFGLWAVTWQQSTTIPPATVDQWLNDLAVVHADFDLPNAAGVDYEAETRLLSHHVMEMGGDAEGASSASGTLTDAA